MGKRRMKWAVNLRECPGDKKETVIELVSSISGVSKEDVAEYMSYLPNSVCLTTSKQLAENIVKSLNDLELESTVQRVAMG